MIVLTILAMFAAMNSYSQKTREEIPEQYKWDLNDLYESDEAWRQAFDDLSSRLDEVEQFKGTLTQSAGNLLKALEFNTGIAKEASKIYLYAGISSDLQRHETRVAVVVFKLWSQGSLYRAGDFSSRLVHHRKVHEGRAQA